MTISRYRTTRFWAVWDTAGALVCVCVYRRGAEEVVRRLRAPAAATDTPLPADPFWDPVLAQVLAAAPRSPISTAGTQMIAAKENSRP